MSFWKQTEEDRHGKPKKRIQEKIRNYFKNPTEYDSLATKEEIDKKRKQALYRKLILVVVVLPILYFLINVGFKFFSNLEEAKERARAKVVEEKPIVKIASNDFSMWQAAKEKQLEDINNRMDDIEYGMESNFREFNNNMKTKFQETLDAIGLEVSSLKNDLNTSISEFQTKTDGKMDYVLQKTSEDIAKLSKRVDDLAMQAENMSPIIDGENMIALEPPRASNEKKVELQPPKKTERPPVVNKEFKVNIKNNEKISTLKKIDTTEEIEEVEKVKIMPGFAKGTVVTGVDAPTLAFGNSNPMPVYIALDSPLSIANNAYENIRDCLLLGTAQGNFSSRRVEVRLSSISCSLSDADGQRYEFTQKVEGWVFGEDGKFAVKGRLVTKEGEIIKTALPLTVLEALITALSNSNIFDKNLNSNEGTEVGIVNPGMAQSSLLEGGASAGSKVLGKLSDIYIKYLESLNPIVEMNAGRKVTIAFKGGEELELKEYKPIDVGEFDMQKLNGFSASKTNGELYEN